MRIATETTMFTDLESFGRLPSKFPQGEVRFWGEGENQFAVYRVEIESGFLLTYQHNGFLDTEGVHRLKQILTSYKLDNETKLDTKSVVFREDQNGGNILTICDENGGIHEFTVGRDLSEKLFHDIGVVQFDQEIAEYDSAEEYLENRE